MSRAVDLVAVRVAVVVLVLALLVVLLRPREWIREVLRKFWLEPSSPLNAGVLRIVIFWMIFRSALGDNAVWYAGLPESQRDLPPGWGWAGATVFDPNLVSVSRVALIISAGAATLGVFTRVSAPLAGLLAVYIFGIPNFFAKINHGHHVRVLCALALAFAPCADALSLDRLFKRLRGVAAPAPSAAYTIPVRAIWVLIGTTYLFPGLWKLWNAGDLWISGRQLKFELYAKWSGLPDFEPLFRVDRHDWLLALLGIATLVFEIGFIFALVNRTTRTIAALSAMLFHLGVAQIMGIRFPAFFPLIVLVEIPERWSAVRRRLPEAVLQAFESWRKRALAVWQGFVERLPSRDPRPWPVRSLWPAGIAAGLLLGGQLATGFTHLNTWPISVYPTFSGRAKKPRKDGSMLLVKLERKGREPVDLGHRLKRMGPARLQILLRNLDAEIEHWGAKEAGRTVVSLFRHSGVELRPKDRVVIYQATWKLLPPGKRKKYREKVSARYEVTESDSLRRLRRR